jgi:flagellar basal-body rod protein FlgC
MSEFDLLSVAADGMNVQRTLLDVAARNVAAAQASTPEHPYPRLVARFASADPGTAFLGVPDAADAFLGVPDNGDGDDADSDAAASRLVGTVPSGETADALTEMIAVLDAQRAYEANASVFDVGKRLAERTIDVGRV